MAMAHWFFTAKFDSLYLINYYLAGMAKLVDALALGASGAIHGGSSPLPGTKIAPFRRVYIIDVIC